MKYLAYCAMKDGETEPPQEIEMAVLQSVDENRMTMPPVRRGWFAGASTGGAISTERFPGARPVWYWEVP